MKKAQFAIGVCVLIFCSFVAPVSSNVAAAGLPGTICWEIAPNDGEITTLQFVVYGIKSGYYILQGRPVMDTHVYATQRLNSGDVTNKPSDMSDIAGSHFVGGAQVLGDQVSITLNMSVSKSSDVHAFGTFQVALDKRDLDGKFWGIYMNQLPQPPYNNLESHFIQGDFTRVPCPK
jgi:hypothetical protein